MCVTSCEVAYYVGNDVKACNKLPPARGFTREKRDGVIALGITDNPCDKIYDNLKKQSIKGTKSFGSGPPRFSDTVSKLYRDPSSYNLSKN